MGYSKEMGGIIIAIGGMLLVQFGLSDGCSGEVMAQLGPVIGALPGLAMSWFARVSKGDVTKLGFRK